MAKKIGQILTNSFSPLFWPRTRDVWSNFLDRKIFWSKMKTEKHAMLWNKKFRYILKYRYDLKTLQLGVDNVGVDNAGKNKIVGVDDEMGVDDVVGSGRGQWSGPGWYNYGNVPRAWPRAAGVGVGIKVGVDNKTGGYYYDAGVDVSEDEAASRWTGSCFV